MKYFYLHWKTYKGRKSVHKFCSGDLRTLLKQIRDNAPVEQSHKIALFWINIGMSYDEVRY